jgi:hypothetical protein
MSYECPKGCTSDNPDFCTECGTQMFTPTTRISLTILNDNGGKYILIRYCSKDGDISFDRVPCTKNIPRNLELSKERMARLSLGDSYLNLQFIQKLMKINPFLAKRVAEVLLINKDKKG